MSRQITWFEEDPDQLADTIMSELDNFDLSEVGREDQKTIILRAVNKYFAEPPTFASMIRK